MWSTMAEIEMGVRRTYVSYFCKAFKNLKSLLRDGSGNQTATTCSLITSLVWTRRGRNFTGLSKLYIDLSEYQCKIVISHSLVRLGIFGQSTMQIKK